jgi:hypothetical protein
MRHGHAETVTIRRHASVTAMLQNGYGFHRKNFRAAASRACQPKLSYTKRQGLPEISSKSVLMVDIR